MKIKRAILLLYSVVIFFHLSISCQSLETNQDNQFKPDNSPTKIDTNFWLKETRGIRDILEDNKGNLWFSSPDYIAKIDEKGLYYFSDNDGLSITGNIHKDENGTIWIENGFRAFKYNGRNFSEEKIDNIKGINALWIQRGLSPTDTTFVEPGLYEVKQDTTHFHPFPIKENIDNKHLHFPTTKAVLGKDGTIWIGTMENVYGLKDNTFITIGRQEMGRQEDEREMGIRGIFVDSRGMLWIADNGAGLFTYDGKEVINFTKKYGLDQDGREGSTLHRAFSIAEDYTGKMWFGTVYSGVWSYSPQTEEFENYTTGINSENIWTIYRTKKELLFAGESPAAVYRFNGNSFDRVY